jgi:hypothetical protein
MSRRLLALLLLLPLLLALQGCPDTPEDDDDSATDDDDSVIDDDDSATDDDDSVIDDDDDTTTDDDDSAGDDDDDTAGDDDDDTTTDDDDDSAGDDDDTTTDDDDSAGDDDDSASVACTLAGSLSCPGTPSVQGNNADLGNISLYDNWGCFTDPLTGPEVIYEYIATATTILDITLSGLSADLDLVVLEGSCTPAACITSSNIGGPISENISLAVTAGQSYYIVVDGWAGATSDFDLAIGCATTGDDDDSASPGDDDDDDSAGWTAAQCNSTGALGCTFGSDQSANNNDPGSSQQVDSYSCDLALDESGPEFVYSYTPAQDLAVTFTLSGLSDDLDLFVLQASSGGNCDPDTCIEYSAGLADESVTFTALSGVTYYLVVDGHLGAISDFDLSLDCPTCSSSGSLDCIASSSDTWNNGISGSSNQISEYSCVPSISETGPEFIYEFIAPVAGNYSFVLSGLTDDLDLFVLDPGPADSCDPALCVDSSTFAGTTDETVSVTTAAEGTLAYLVVDGNAGAISDYTLTAFCPSGLVTANSSTLDCISDTAIDDNSSGSPDIDDWCSIGLSGWTGNELVYAFVPSATGDYIVDLAFGTADLFLAALPESGVPGVADSGDCLDWSDASGPATGETLNFSAVGGQTYYLVVDGWAGDSALFNLSVSCPFCADSDLLNCGQTDSWSNAAPGSTDLFDNYTGCPGYLSGGPEFIYVYTADSDGDATAFLSGLSDDLDVYILAAATDGACSASQCVASSILAGVADDSVTFPTLAGSTYYISIDGFGGALSSYNLSLSCN